MATGAQLLVRGASVVQPPSIDTEPPMPRSYAGFRLASRWAMRLAACGVALTVASAYIYADARAAALASRPLITRPDVEQQLFNAVPMTVLVAAGWQYAAWRTTDREIVSSPALWRRMDIAEWQSVPGPLRERALDNMFTHYRSVLMAPRTWDAMSPADWDGVPQPMRVVAYRQMLAYWSGFYNLGAACGLPPRVVADTLAAIVMTESWFVHRVVVVNARGNRDVGLAQASDYARSRLRDLHAAGVVDIALAEDEYLDPWKATRFVALWMSLLLDEADGNFDVAIRAYHRGIARAGDRLGAAYLDTVQQRLNRYIRNRDAPQAWDDVWRKAADLERQEWPWAARSSP